MRTEAMTHSPVKPPGHDKTQWISVEPKYLWHFSPYHLHPSPATSLILSWPLYPLITQLQPHWPSWLFLTYPKPILVSGWNSLPHPNLASAGPSLPHLIEVSTQRSSCQRELPQVKWFKVALPQTLFISSKDFFNQGSTRVLSATENDFHDYYLPSPKDGTQLVSV